MELKDTLELLKYIPIGVGIVVILKTYLVLRRHRIR